MYRCIYTCICTLHICKPAQVGGGDKAKQEDHPHGSDTMRWGEGLGSSPASHAHINRCADIYIYLYTVYMYTHTHTLSLSPFFSHFPSLSLSRSLCSAPKSLLPKQSQTGEWMGSRFFGKSAALRQPYALALWNLIIRPPRRRLLEV